MIVHVDDAMIVLDKPAGLLAVPGRTNPDCAAACVQAVYADARVVHRLDMATSGLMLLARGAAMQRVLSRAFEQRRVAKRYVAVVQGRLHDECGTIDQPIGADWVDRPRRRIDRVRGRPAVTHWRVLAREATTTRVELEPVTGRTHQLRVHLAAIGHPIVGDALYAAPAAAAPRLMLHACDVALTHPRHGATSHWHAPPPF